MTNPYHLPDDGIPRIVNFSGGRSSGYMLWHILQAHGGALPDYARVAFANTGKERNETLDFVQECGERWNVDIAWLEYRNEPDRAGGPKDPRHLHVVVNHNSASRNGEPFTAVINAKSMLPNIAMSFCSQELKTRTVGRFVRRDLGWPVHIDVLGMRHDEPKRWKDALMKHCKTEYPMVHAEVDEKAVLDWWKEHPFDLGIHGDYGNCDLCFKKGAGKLQRLIGEEPERLKWWTNHESLENQKRWGSGRHRPSRATWSKRWTYEELARQAPLPFDDPSIDCFCGD